MNTQASERSVIDDVKRLLFVAGDWREAAGGQTMVVEDSSTGEALCNVADARREGVLGVLISFSSKLICGIRPKGIPLALSSSVSSERPALRR